jgi:ketosteroid isomerase-like protein
MTVDDVAVRVFGDAAVVTGRTVARGNSPGAAPVELRFTDVFVRQDGRWLAVASQGTPVAR